MPFFSIIVPVYNTEKYIQRCLKSCINQSFSDLEIIVVNDCSTDNSIEIIKDCMNSDTRIKLITNTTNLGLFHSRIIGEECAMGNFIVHVDGDDFIHTNLCENIFELIHKGGG